MKKSLQVVLLAAAVAATSAKANNILGIDVSSSQGSINWTSVHGAGVDFAFVRATEGNYFQDLDYLANMNGGKSAGVQMGAYEFGRPDIDTPATEANYFWAFAGGKILADGKSISPAIDFEIFGGHVGAASYTAWVNAWAADVKAKTAASMFPVLYVGCVSMCDFTSKVTLRGWLPNYNGENLYTGNPGNPCSCAIWTTWTYWQCSTTGSIPGISGDVDLDAYNGNLASLKSDQGVGGL